MQINLKHNTYLFLICDTSAKDCSIYMLNRSSNLEGVSVVANFSDPSKRKGDMPPTEVLVPILALFALKDTVSADFGNFLDMKNLWNRLDFLQTLTECFFAPFSGAS